MSSKKKSRTTVSISLTPNDKNKITRAAREADLTVSRLCRRIVLRGIAQTGGSNA
ncbi:MAG: hypothetical protein JXD23_08080 [Spirochaetales bacterium]|nr:hypothetical protein [Spirochaetales bacterium]